MHKLFHLYIKEFVIATDILLWLCLRRRFVLPSLVSAWHFSPVKRAVAEHGAVQIDEPSA